MDNFLILGVVAAAEGDHSEARVWMDRMPGPGGFGALIAALLGDAKAVSIHIAQTPDDPHTGIVGDRDPLFEEYWRDADFMAATAVRR